MNKQIDIEEIVTLFTDSYHGRDTSWVEKMAEAGWQDLKKSDFVEENGKWYWIVDFRGPDNKVHGFRINYTEKDEKFEYAGIRK